MGTYNTFKNTPAEREGITLDFGGDGKFRIARAGGSNDRFQKQFSTVMRQYKRQLETETLDPKVADRVLAEVFADTVVLGWEGVTDENGQPLAFSRDAAIKLFLDLPDLFLEVRKAAEKPSLFRAQLNEADAKN